MPENDPRGVVSTAVLWPLFSEHQLERSPVSPHVLERRTDTKVTRQDTLLGETAFRLFGFGHVSKAEQP